LLPVTTTLLQPSEADFLLPVLGCRTTTPACCTRQGCWHIYRMIGKLSSRVYVLSAPG
jgi:hypothetical protein